MSLLQNWRDIAYNQEADKKQLQQFWTNYFLIEKNIYEQLLSNPDEVVKGTVKELAEKYKVDVMTMVGFLDGINDSLKEPNPLETMEEDTEVNLNYDKELLYKNMVEAKAEWLYNLPQWDKLLTEERRKELVKQVKKYTEDAKVAVRNIRRDAMDKFKAQKKASEITEDDYKIAEKDLQKLTDDWIKEIEKISEKKEKELFEI